MTDISKIKIVADSSADLVEYNGISFASSPLKIKTAEKEYIDNLELDVFSMVNDLKNYKGKSGTSCPNPEDWITAFGDAECIFCITITATLSGSFNSAMIAKEMYESSHPERRVYVFNSLTTGPEMVLVIDKFKSLIIEGTPFDEACEKAVAYSKSTGLFFLLESLKNLANNGRVKPIVAKMAGLLGIRLLGKASDAGDLEPLEKCRGEGKALEAIINQLKAHGYRNGKIKIAHCFNETAANKLSALVKNNFGDVAVEIYPCRGLVGFYAELGGLLIGFEKN